ncbi:hypothetical protein VNI00_004718 [Paramarasmius palmivorus]|uniref:F-box domain-containing protein n=1 Tax=Paramarasmius palmivorus TaxID=297713 RepID=A0AAW0DIY6_9AGAR
MSASRAVLRIPPEVWARIWLNYISTSGDDDRSDLLHQLQSVSRAWFQGIDSCKMLWATIAARNPTSKDVFRTSKHLMKSSPYAISATVTVTETTLDEADSARAIIRLLNTQSTFWKHITWDFAGYWFDPEALAPSAVRGAPILETFCLAYSDPPFSLPVAGSDALLSFLGNCPSLVVLSVTGRHRPKRWGSSGYHWPNLTHFTSNLELTSAFAIFLLHCKNLRFLCILECSLGSSFQRPAVPVLVPRLQVARVFGSMSGRGPLLSCLILPTSAEIDFGYSDVPMRYFVPFYELSRCKVETLRLSFSGEEVMALTGLINSLKHASQTLRRLYLWCSDSTATALPSSTVLHREELRLSKSAGLDILIRNNIFSGVACANTRRAITLLVEHIGRWRTAKFIFVSPSDMGGPADFFDLPAPALRMAMIACERDVQENWAASALKWLRSCALLIDIDFQVSIRNKIPLTLPISLHMPLSVTALTSLSSYFALDVQFLDLLRLCVSLRALEIFSLAVDESALPANGTRASVPSLEALRLSGPVIARSTLLLYLDLPSTART